MGTLGRETAAALAERLDEAQLKGCPINKITDEHPGMDRQDAYDVQWALRSCEQGRGHRIVGWKMGLTSWAKMKQMGAEVPIYAFLADASSIQDGGEIDTHGLIHPKVEAEIAVVTGRDLSGPGCHIAQVAAAVDWVLPAIEVIDSRYEGFQFDLNSLIADNGSAACYAVGGRSRRLEELDLKTLGVVLEKNGRVVETGAGAGALGHPLASVAMLANLLAERGEDVCAGTLILTGSLVEAVAVGPGDAVRARYQGLGTVSLKFT